jgi:ferric-dicitrate binding protein FerR (iron transport regulator)
MSTHKQTIPQFLDHTFARFRDLPRSHVDAACDRVLHRLQDQVRRTPVADTVPHGLRRLRIWRPFAVIAAVAVVVVAVLFVQTRELTLAEGEILRTSGDVVVLRPNWSRLEVRAQSEVFVEPADDGIRLRLNRGALIVNTAGQRDGKIHVRTDHLTATVAVGVFLVSAEQEGSRVAVIQGDVLVQQGTSRTSLAQGEQFATSPQMESRTVPSANVKETSSEGYGPNRNYIGDCPFESRGASVSAPPGARL